MLKNQQLEFDAAVVENEAKRQAYYQQHSFQKSAPVAAAPVPVPACDSAALESTLKSFGDNMLSKMSTMIGQKAEVPATLTSRVSQETAKTLADFATKTADNASGEWARNAIKAVEVLDSLRNLPWVEGHMCGLRAATEIVAEDPKASNANIVSKLVGVAQAQGLLMQPAATMMMLAAQVLPAHMMMGQVPQYQQYGQYSQKVV